MAEAPAERITEAEHAVMEVLWAKAPQSATEVAEALDSARGWGLPTVKTLLARLVAKGAIKAEAEGRRFHYRPLVARAGYVGHESRRLIDRLFGGRAAPLLAHLAEAEALSEDDLAEIEALLKRLRA